MLLSKIEVIAEANDKSQRLKQEVRADAEITNGYVNRELHSLYRKTNIECKMSLQLFAFRLYPFTTFSNAFNNSSPLGLPQPVQASQPFLTGYPGALAIPLFLGPSTPVISLNTLVPIL